MRTILTSHYSMLARVSANKDLVPIAISRSVPRWFAGKSALWLAPSSGLLHRYKNQGLSHEDYTLTYKKELLDRQDAHEVANRLFDMAGEGKTPVLFCYEKAGDFCHRHLLAEWFEAHGIPCHEHENQPQKKEDQEQQQDTWLKLC